MSHSNEISYGYCQCGCGQKTALAPRTYTKSGIKKGQPLRYIYGHSQPRRKRGTDNTELPCTRCKRVLPVERFSVTKTGSYKSWCKECNATTHTSDHHRERTYGITKAEFDGMRDEQKNQCAICQSTFTKTPHVDHCHKTGIVRGLLCKSCNHMLGMADDNLDTLRNAVLYLQKSRERNRE